MKRPVIGVVGRSFSNDKSGFFLYDEYRQAILLSGGIPIVLVAPYSKDISDVTSFHSNISEREKNMIYQMVDLCDGILFPGGSAWYGFDQEIYTYAYKKDKPILGICLGMQMIACSTFFSFENSDCTQKIISSINHQQTKDFVHKVILKESLLKEILGANEIFVNSRHSFSILKNDSFQISSYSTDGVIESIEIPNKTFILGVQWHPESLFSQDIFSQKLFHAFIKACK